MNEMPSNASHPIDVVWWVWFALTALAVAYVAYDQFKGGPEPKENSLAMKTVRWGWVLVTLYTGPFGFIVYWFLHRAPARKSPAPSAPPRSEWWIRRIVPRAAVRTARASSVRARGAGTSKQ